MTELALGRLDASEDGGWLVLSGANQPPGLVSTQYDLCLSPEEAVNEHLGLNLRGSAAQTRSILETLEGLLNPSRQSVWSPLTLRLWSTERSRYLYSRIIAARLETIGGHLASHAGGSLRLNLRIQREGFFFGDSEALPLSNGSAGGITNGLTLFNHEDDDLGHDNWFTVQSAELNLAYPASLKIELENTTPGSDLGDFWVGGMTSSAEESRPILNLEAEGAVGGVIAASPGASGGKYSQYRWSGSAWTTLATWTLGPVEVSQLRQRTVTPIARFFTPLADANLSLRLQIAQAGKVVWQSPESNAQAGLGSLAMDPICLPLGSLPLVNFAYSHQLILQARHTAQGEHVLELDDLLLLPHEPFVLFKTITGLPQLSKIVDDGTLGQNWSLRGGLELKTHRRIGGKLALQPCCRHHFWVFQCDTAQRAPIERTLKARAWFRRQWRLP